MKLIFFTTLKSSIIHFNGFTAALIAAMILGGTKDVSGEKLTGVTSQKQAIETLKAQGKILPNVPTDYTHYGKFYSNTNTYIYHEWPYSSKWQRFQANNLRDVDGKNIEIQNDIDSCNFLNESVYKANLSRIVPIIIDTQIDTLGAAPGEYERVDRENSWSFLGGTPNKESITVKTGTGMNFGTHMNVMADVISAKQDNFTEQDYAGGLDVRSGREEVGVRPGKTRLYIDSPASGGNVETSQYDHIYDEAKNNPDKKFILSCSWTGASPDTNNGFNKLGTLDNVIIFVARNDGAMSGSTISYAGNANSIEVGYVQAPALTVLDQSTQKINFASEQNDRVVPNPGKSQTGKMRGDGFCILGEWSTSASTAFMTGIAANIWAQNPDWTKEDLLAMLKRDVYKPMPGKLLVTPILSAIDGNIVYGEPYDDLIKYDANGWNERFGYGVAQPGKTMKENIFPEIKEPKNTRDGKYYFTVSNFPAEYIIQGEGVSKDDNGYYVDLSALSPGKHKITFVGKCPYEGKVYDFPIDRTLEVVGLESPMVEGLSGNYKRQNDDINTGKIWLKEFRGKLMNYTPGIRVDIELNGVKIENISVNADGSFVLTNLSDYPFPFNGNDVDLKITYVDDEGNQNWIDTKLPSSVLTGKKELVLPELKIYPNPVKDILNIDLGADIRDVQIKIYNISGQLYSVENLSYQDNKIDVSSLKTGVYFVTIIDDKGAKRTEKIIKQ